MFQGLPGSHAAPLGLLERVGMRAFLCYKHLAPTELRKAVVLQKLFPKSNTFLVALVYGRFIGLKFCQLSLYQREKISSSFSP